MGDYKYSSLEEQKLIDNILGISQYNKKTKGEIKMIVNSKSIEIKSINELEGVSNELFTILVTGDKVRVVNTKSWVIGFSCDRDDSHLLTAINKIYGFNITLLEKATIPILESVATEEGGVLAYGNLGWRICIGGVTYDLNKVLSKHGYYL